MNKEEKVKYWLDLVDYDLDTAETLYNGGRWLYVAFMCHQVIEKVLKAYGRPHRMPSLRTRTTLNDWPQVADYPMR